MTTLEIFQGFKRILCVCPCCAEIKRLSDLRLEYLGKTQKTWYDQLDEQKQNIEEKSAKFEEKEDSIRQKSAEKGRKLVQEAMGKLVDTTFKKHKIDPYDVKPVFHPVDYIVFEGYNKDETDVKQVTLLSRPVRNPTINLLREQVKNAIEKKEYGWKTVRLTEEGKMEYE